MALSDYMISSRTWATQTPTIDGSPTAVTAATAGLYLYHPTASLSLLARVVAALTAAGVASPAAFLTEAGFVRLTSSGTFTITWNAATTLRDLLGFADNLAAGAAYTAPARSTLLWRAGKRLRPERSPLGTHGQYVADVAVHVGPQGVQTVREEGEPTVVQVYSAQHIPKDRFWTAQTEAAGDFMHFWRRELLAGRQWYLLAAAREGDSTTVAADLSTATPLGPYVPDLTDAALRRGQFSRDVGFENVEAYYPIRVPCIKCAEFS